MTVTINGEQRELRDGTTVAELLATLGAGPNGIAVACNDRVVNRSSYESYRINPGDRVEVIRAVAGGEGASSSRV